MSESLVPGEKEYTLEDVAAHNKRDDLWVVIDGIVYDLTKFVKLDVAGKDVTKDFYAMHRADTLDAKKYKKLKIGVLAGSKPKIKKYQPGKLSRVPLAEPITAIGSPNPYYTESHHKAIREFTDKEVIPEAMEEEEGGEPPSLEMWQKDVRKDDPRTGLFFVTSARASPNMPLPLLRGFRSALGMAGNVLRQFFFSQFQVFNMPNLFRLRPGLAVPVGRFGILVSRVGKPAMKAKWMGDIKLPGGVKPEEFDYFHEQIAHEEYGRLGAPSYQDGLGAGFVIGLIPVIYFAPPALQDQVVPPCLSGDKRICLAVSEAWVGSDVASMRTHGKLSDCGQFWIVNGMKKWITNGAFCDYFVTAVRTGGKGMKGISLMLIERSEGLTTKPMKTSYGSCAGTAYVFYDDVKVPVQNVMGELNDGFKCIMWNFNHERWFIICSLISAMRLCYEDCILWLNQRIAFGKPLLDQPVLRQHLAKIQAGLEVIAADIAIIAVAIARKGHSYDFSIRSAPTKSLRKHHLVEVRLNLNTLTSSKECDSSRPQGRDEQADQSLGAMALLLAITVDSGY
eukprot:gene259-325_t